MSINATVPERSPGMGKREVLGSFKALTVEDFIAVRSYLADELEKVSTQSKIDTRERQAEHLMKLGVIDFDAVITKLQLKHYAEEEVSE